jgi:hypothetical protein
MHPPKITLKLKHRNATYMTFAQKSCSKNIGEIDTLWTPKNNKSTKVTFLPEFDPEGK